MTRKGLDRSTESIAAAPSTLELHVLGPLRIVHDGEDLAKSISRRGQALIAYLAVTHQTWTRSSIASLLWGETLDSNARHNLRNLLTELRRSMSPYLEITRTTLAFNVGGTYRLDLEVLQQTVEISPGELDLEQLEMGPELYGGEFLAGLHIPNAPRFDEWLFEQREMLREQTLDGFQSLAEHCLQQGELTLGLRYTRRILSLEPWLETAHQLQMRLLMRNGQRSEALKQYAICVDVLAEELGVTPMPETTALYEHIRGGQLDPPQQRRPTYRDPRSTDVEVRLSTRQIADQLRVDLGDMLRSDNFYGRSDELSTLRAWLNDGTTKLAAIVGIGGQGKTTLAAKIVADLLDERSERQFDCIIWRSLQHMPSVETLLRSWVYFLSEQEINTLPEASGQQFELLRDLLQRQRCLMVLDNVESVLNLQDRLERYQFHSVEYDRLFRQFYSTDHNSCLLLTSRSLPRSIDAAALSTQTIRIQTLGGLSMDDAAAMLADQIGRSIQHQTSTHRLIEQISANPLALLLSAARIRDFYEGDLNEYWEHAHTSGHGLESVLLDQWRNLSESERTILIHVALSQAPITVDQIAAMDVYGRSLQYDFEAISRLRRHGLMRVEGRTLSLLAAIQEIVVTLAINRLADELMQFVPGQPSQLDPLDANSYINRFALTHLDLPEWVRQIQKETTINRLGALLTTRAGANNLGLLLKNALSFWQTLNGPPGYFASNLLHIATQLGLELDRLDFSSLPLRNADLRSVDLPEVNFRACDLTHTLWAGITDAVRVVRFSDDGVSLIAADAAGIVRIWDVVQHRLAASWQAHVPSGPLTISALSVEPRTSRLATTGGDRTIRIWDWNRQTLLRELSLPSTRPLNWGVLSIAFTHDGQHLLSAGFDDEVARLWHVESGELMSTYAGHEGSVLSVAVSADGRQFASAGQEGTIIIWDRDLGEEIHRLQAAVYPHLNATLAFSPADPILAVAGEDGQVQLYDTGDWSRRIRLNGRGGSITGLAFSMDGVMLAVSSTAEQVRIWDMTAVKDALQHQQKSLSPSEGMKYSLISHETGYDAIAFAPGNRTLATAGGDGTIRLWDVTRSATTQTYVGYSRILMRVDFNAGGKWVAAVGTSRTVTVWDVFSGERVAALGGHQSTTTAISFSSTGKSLAISDASGWLHIWQISDQEFTGHITQKAITFDDLAFSPDGRLLAGVGADNNIWLFDTATMDVVRRLVGHRNRIWQIAFTPDGNHLLSTGQGEGVWLWETAGDNQPRHFDSHQKKASTFAVSTDGNLLAISHETEPVSLYHLGDQRLLKTLYHASSHVCDLVFSRSADRLIVSHSSGEIECIDVQSEQTLWRTPATNLRIFSSVLHPSRDWLATCGVDGLVHLWNLDSGQMLREFSPQLPYEGLNLLHTTGLSLNQLGELGALGART